MISLIKIVNVLQEQISIVDLNRYVKIPQAKTLATLTIVIYICYMFIVQATGGYPRVDRQLQRKIFL